MLSERELNPYWKDGGTGLPPEKDEEASVKKGKEQLLVIILNFCLQFLDSVANKLLLMLLKQDYE